MCLGFCSDFKRIVESGALIFKVVDRNPRLDQLLPGQGFSILVTLSFLVQGSHCKYMCIYK